MTKAQLLALIEGCSDDARVTVVDKDGYVYDASGYWAVAVEGFRKVDEIFLEAADVQCR